MTLIASVYTASLRHPDTAKFSISSLLDSALPVIHPIVAAGSNRCETLKSFFGISYEKMQQKNVSFLNEMLNIDLIKKEGSFKYNLTSTKRLKRLVNNNKKIIILIHGYMESSDGIMVQALAPEYLKKPDTIVMALDGRKVINLEYFRSSTYARFMGEKLGTFLSEMIKNGQEASSIMLVGHSLGAHIAGVAGKRVYQLTKKLIGRITGLDPAGPCFSNVGPFARLVKTDAVYVDVIHTNAGMLGLMEPLGHKDFYPNGGMSQPGCILYTCDHSRAWELLSEAVNNPDHFPGRKCENWTLYKEGHCNNNQISYMGPNSEGGSSGNYFLTTNSSVPFGLGPAGVS